jgi:hypothetical protein
MISRKHNVNMDKPVTMTGWKPAWRFFVFDTLVNWALGMLFLFFSRQVESFISDQQILPGWFWMIAGAGLLLFGFWQTYIVATAAFTPIARLFSCVLAWLPFVALTIALLCMGFPVRPLARVLIWTGNIYMFTLGVLYLVSWYKSKIGNHEKEQ